MLHLRNTPVKIALWYFVWFDRVDSKKESVCWRATQIPDGHLNKHCSRAKSSSKKSLSICAETHLRILPLWFKAALKNKKRIIGSMNQRRWIDAITGYGAWANLHYSWHALIFKAPKLANWLLNWLLFSFHVDNINFKKPTIPLFSFWIKSCSTKTSEAARNFQRNCRIYLTLNFGLQGLTTVF